MEVTGYVYKADIHCPPCLLQALPTGPGEDFDGWKDVSEPPMTVEENLDELAAAFTIDRNNETSFDSDDFPKVILSLDDDDATCGTCGEELGQ